MISACRRRRGLSAGGPRPDLVAAGRGRPGDYRRRSRAARRRNHLHTRGRANNPQLPLPSFGYCQSHRPIRRCGEGHSDPHRRHPQTSLGLRVLENWRLWTAAASRTVQVSTTRCLSRTITSRRPVVSAPPSRRCGALWGQGFPTMTSRWKSMTSLSWKRHSPPAPMARCCSTT